MVLTASAAGGSDASVARTAEKAETLEGPVDETRLGNPAANEAKVVGGCDDDARGRIVLAGSEGGDATRGRGGREVMDIGAVGLLRYGE